MSLQPLDIWTWMISLMVVITCMIIWRLGGNSWLSIWYIPFFLWSFYHGNAIRFATKKKFLVALLQLLVIVSLYNSIVYQATFTSDMISVEQLRLTSFDDLLDSNYKIFISIQAEPFVVKFTKYQAAFEQNRIILQKGKQLESVIHEGIAMFVGCEKAKYFAATSDQQSYVIEEHLFKHYNEFHVSFLNRYLKRWQLLMDWCFEAGLLNFWKSLSAKGKLFHPDEVNRNNIIGFDEIFMACRQLIFGSLIAAFALICEIFWKEFLEPLIKRLRSTRRVGGLKMNRLNIEKVYKAKQDKIQKTKVRRIQVRPIETTL